MGSIVKRYLKARVENASIGRAKAVFDASNRVNAMQKTFKTIGAAAMAIMTLAVIDPADSGAAGIPDPVVAALDPCPLPLPMQPDEAVALRFEGWQRSGLVLRTRVPLPPQADTGFGCPITRTAT